MPNGSKQSGITRESFIRAWVTGDTEAQAGYLYDMLNGQNDRLCKLEVWQQKLNLKWAGIAGGLVVLTFIIPLALRFFL